MVAGADGLTVNQAAATHQNHERKGAFSSEGKLFTWGEGALGGFEEFTFYQRALARLEQ